MGAKRISIASLGITNYAFGISLGVVVTMVVLVVRSLLSLEISSVFIVWLGKIA